MPAKLRPWMGWAAVLFVLMWLLMMTTSLAAHGCRNRAKPDATRLRMCNAALTVAQVTPFRSEPQKLAQTHMTRAIRLANLGQPDAAMADMRAAVQMVTDGRPRGILPVDAASHDGALLTATGAAYWQHMLVAQVRQSDASDAARALWGAVLAEIATGG